MNELVRVTFPLSDARAHGFATERLWARRVSGARYRLQNSPFYAMGVSFNDIVFATSDSNGCLVFSGVSIRGGHSTYRIALQTMIDGELFCNLWTPLEKLGCRYEGANSRLLAIDVPPSADIYSVFALLETGESAGVWGFEEAHCGHLPSRSGAIPDPT